MPKWTGNIERSTHATNYAALTALPRPFTTSTRLRPTSAFSGSEIGLGHCTPKTLTTPLLEQHNAYRGGKTTLCGTRGEIAFMANRSRALLWTVVVIVWFIWKLETAVSRPTFNVISLPRCTIILLKRNSIRIFDSRWFICATLSI